MTRLTCFILIFVSIALTACSSGKQDYAREPLLPLPTDYTTLRDPDNTDFMAAITQYVHAKAGPSNTRYEFTRIDLDNDGRREGIVIMKTPHKFWCGDNGCNMAVFKAYNDDFKLVSEIAPVRGPLLISDHKTKGWRDIIVRVSGRTGFNAKDVALQFNGHTYPAQPAFQHGTYASNVTNGVRIFP